MNKFVDSVGRLNNDIRRRFSSPLNSVTFYTHLFLAVIICGGAGIWYEFVISLVKNNWQMESFSAALFTYFPAIVALAILEIIQEEQPYFRSFGLLTAGLFLVMFIFAVITVSLWQLFWSIVGSLLAVVFWWIANGERPCFKDINPETATGGSTSSPLMGANDPDWKK